jgi:hypothetical protein
MSEQKMGPTEFRSGVQLMLISRVRPFARYPHRLRRRQQKPTSRLTTKIYVVQ